ncbi:hypothetical protein BDZ97DRAFT_1917462 [Flammula alnicola]|nr:hypothetical protein BDZ97DRAFT_1917462 [Flammula alnicola]
MFTLYWYVRGYSHLEYGEGFIIFDRDDGNKEVWRRMADIPVPPHTTSDGAAADAEPQIDPNPNSTQLFPRRTPTPSLLLLFCFYPPRRTLNSKARFTPHAVLHMPEATSAFRFVYPHLLVVSLERAFVWDVRTGKVVETVEGIQVIQPGGRGDHDGESEEEEDDQNTANPSPGSWVASDTSTSPRDTSSS